MLSVFVNAGAVVIGSLLGMLLRKGIPERYSDILMKGLGLCTLYVGISGTLKGKNTTILIVSIVIGALLGEWLDLDGKLERFGFFLESKFKSKNGKKVSIAEGFITASLLFCVGAMAIVGSLESGLTGNHQTIFTKSLLDFVAAIVFASSMGIGVALSAILVIVYQGAIVLLASWISPLLTDKVIAEMVCCGSLIIVALAFNMLGITKIKVMNYIPAIFIPMILAIFISL
jgi:uncharacterized membrane protein YqgA involved in biofilm formation